MAKKPINPQDIVSLTRHIDMTRGATPGTTLGEAIGSGLGAFQTVADALKEYVASRPANQMTLDDAKFLVVALQQIGGSTAAIGSIEEQRCGNVIDAQETSPRLTGPRNGLALVAAEYEARAQRTKQ